MIGRLSLPALHCKPGEKGGYANAVCEDGLGWGSVCDHGSFQVLIQIPAGFKRQLPSATRPRALARYLRAYWGGVFTRDRVPHVPLLDKDPG